MYTLVRFGSSSLGWGNALVSYVRNNFMFAIFLLLVAHVEAERECRLTFWVTLHLAPLGQCLSLKASALICLG